MLKNIIDKKNEKNWIFQFACMKKIIPEIIKKRKMGYFGRVIKNEKYKQL